MYMGPTDGNRCSEDLWCPVEPAIPATLRAMGGTGPNDVWAVGEAGTMLHWDGTRLTRVPTNTRGEIEDIYAAAPNDVWAIASPKQLLHFNGSTWSPVTVSTLDYPIKMSGQRRELDLDPRVRRRHAPLQRDDLAEVPDHASGAASDKPATT